jgi:hypothetical protein
MAVDPFTFAKALGGRLLSFAGSLVKAGLAKRLARNRAIRGEDLSSEGSLEHMVRAELGKLATSSALPQGLQSDAAREWLTSDACAGRFVETLIADAGGDPVLARRARDELANRYEQAMGETRRRAKGPLNLEQRVFCLPDAGRHGPVGHHLRAASARQKTLCFMESSP